MPDSFDNEIMINHANENTITKPATIEAPCFWLKPVPISTIRDWLPEQPERGPLFQHQPSLPAGCSLAVIFPTFHVPSRHLPGAMACTFRALNMQTNNPSRRVPTNAMPSWTERFTSNFRACMQRSSRFDSCGPRYDCVVQQSRTARRQHNVKIESDWICYCSGSFKLNYGSDHDWQIAIDLRWVVRWSGWND